MSRSFRVLGWDERDHLASCLSNVSGARDRLREAQRAPGGRGVYRLRMELVDALEAYERVLTEIGAPLPRQLQSEIRLQRGIGHRN